MRRLAVLSLSIGLALAACAPAATTIAASPDRSRGHLGAADLSAARLAFETRYVKRLTAPAAITDDGPAVRKMRDAWAARDAGDPARAVALAGEAASIATSAEARGVAIARAQLVISVHRRRSASSIRAIVARGFGEGPETELIVAIVAAAMNGDALPPAGSRLDEALARVQRSEEPDVDAWLATDLVMIYLNREERYDDAIRLLGSPAAGAAFDRLPERELRRLAMAFHSALASHGAEGRQEGARLVTATVPLQTKELAPFRAYHAPYTDAEVRAGPCKDAYAGGRQAIELQVVRAAFLDGRSGPESALAALADLRAAKLVDVEVFAGSMHEALGDDRAARDEYWRARERCPFDARAVDGTFGVMSRIQAREALDATTPAVPDHAPALERYIMNYARLSRRQRDAVAVALEFWFPYLGLLSEKGRGAYLKPTFERMSDAPQLRGHAMPPGARAPDGRLYDEIGALGGDTIVVSASTLGDGTSGTFPHEVAHQFEHETPLAIAACIGRLYRRAKARGLFATGYAARNEHEYFAMAVEHIVAREDGGHVSGIDAAWYEAHDPDMRAFVQSIGASNGDLTRVRCRR